MRLFEEVERYYGNRGISRICNEDVVDEENEENFCEENFESEECDIESVIC